MWVAGDSMTGACIYDGDIIAVEGWRKARYTSGIHQKYRPQNGGDHRWKILKPSSRQYIPCMPVLKHCGISRDQSSYCRAELSSTIVPWKTPMLPMARSKRPLMSSVRNSNVTIRAWRKQ